MKTIRVGSRESKLAVIQSELVMEAIRAHHSEITLELVKEGEELDVYHLSENPLTWEVFALHREGCYIGQVEQALFEIAEHNLKIHKKKL